ncbi:hypothetical protein M0Q50_08005 [bacterium]|jgi:hypothetical protein|nr:hypothetical protein [bacterium]
MKNKIYQTVKKEPYSNIKILNYPKYVNMVSNNSSEISVSLQRQIDEEDGTITYYRKAGDWNVGCKLIEGKLKSINLYNKDFDYMNDKLLIPITKKEHDKNNII